LLQRLENRLDGLLGLGAADVGRGNDGIYEVQLNQIDPPALVRQMLEVAGLGCQDMRGNLH
jgi:hypothetical protein